MTTPPIVIKEHAKIAYAAELMLKHKLHRLPVVDQANKVVGTAWVRRAKQSGLACMACLPSCLSMCVMRPHLALAWEDMTKMLTGK